MADELIKVGQATKYKRFLETPTTEVVAEMVFPGPLRWEIIEHPFARGYLTTNGVQYSAATTSTAGSTWTAVETATINPPFAGTLVEAEFGLTASVAVSSAAYTVNHKWQACNVGSTWVDLTSAAHSTTIGSTAFTEVTLSGYFSTGSANFNAIPCQVRLAILSTGTTGQTITARTKNSSYVRLVYEST